MQFTMTSQRQPFGQQVQVQVSCALPPAIARVTTTFDASPIGDDTLPSNSTSYARTFDGQPARIGALHTLVVTAFDQNGNPESATKIWTDAT
ncbi:MAG TPA: hypothetical protein VIX35_11855 [Vicinamibacterales bacterium]